MKLIGITGGVGSGKSQVLGYLKTTYNAEVLLADEAANRLKEPGMPCYEPVVKCLGREVLAEDGTIDKIKMASIIFSDKRKLEQINCIIHPAVRTYIEDCIRKEKEKKEKDFFFLEAALLLEEGYDAILDEVWYVFAKEQVRRQRLKEGRGYSDEKIDAIIRQQMKDIAFREKCDYILDNSGDFETTKKQIDQKMGVYLCKE